MKQRGFTSIELIELIVGIAIFLFFVGGIWVLYHFIAKFW